MNIKSATKQIEGAVRAYLAKDEDGTYLIAPQMQRPIIMMGPPGVGKTAVVSQVAERLGVNFVSYSITHHTRQSALGLPYIDEATYGGTTYKVSRYTMSEIIASVYDSMAASKVDEGILFLDEINCASETLMPAMLQFLQYKTFGQHRLPLGWVIVCAGNPPAYNRGARDFDPAMLDRLKRIDVEPDLAVWQEYAASHGVHPAVTSYLQAKPDRFYLVRAGVAHTRIVTARGWEDLSRMLQAYERVGLEPDLDLVSQYLQDADTAEDFWVYLQMFLRYRRSCNVRSILDGSFLPDDVEHAACAGADEKIAVVGMLTSSVLERVHAVDATEQVLGEERPLVADALGHEDQVAKCLAQSRRRLSQLQADGTASDVRRRREAERVRLWERLAGRVGGSRDAASQAATSEALRAEFNQVVRQLGARLEQTSDQVDSALDFVGQAFGEGDMALMAVSRLATDPAFMRFQAHHGSARFQRMSSQLMLDERGLGLLKEADQLKQAQGQGGVEPLSEDQKE